MNYMEKTRRINEKFDKGLFDGAVGTYHPGRVWGIFREAYKKGHEQGSKMRIRLTDFKTKK